MKFAVLACALSLHGAAGAECLSDGHCALDMRDCCSGKVHATLKCASPISHRCGCVQEGQCAMKVDDCCSGSFHSTLDCGGSLVGGRCDSGPKLASNTSKQQTELFHWNGEPWRVGSGGDPAGSWLSYAVYKAPAGSLITRVNTSWTVPSGRPTRSGSNAPGWWYGVQTAKGNGALVQPILACDYMGSSCQEGSYVVFDGVYDWTTPWHGMYESKILSAKEGDKINSWLTCTTEECTQYIANERTGESATFPYKLHNPSGDKEAALYFVLEHQPSNCDAFPPNGVCVFSDIYVEVDGKAVTPQWEAKQEQPACGSKMTVIDSKTLAVTWNGGTPPSPSSSVVV